MNLKEFQEKWIVQFRPYTSDDPAFEDSPETILKAKEMISDAFPWLEPFSDLLLLGKGEKSFGGVGGHYDQSVLPRLYEGLCFSLMTDWFIIGLDKCELRKLQPNNKFTWTQTKYDTTMSFTGYHTTNCVIAQSDESYYTKLMVKGQSNFVRMVQRLVRNQGQIEIMHGVICAEDAEYIYDGFSSSDEHKILELIS